MAMRKKQIIRQIKALVLVGIALLVLFGRGYVFGIAQRTHIMMSPKGFRVFYYKNADLSGKAKIRSERALVCDYGDRAPVLGLTRNNYSIRWEGYLEVPAEAEYSFFLQSEGGARFFLDDELIIDKWDDHNWTPGKHGKARLEPRTYHVVLEHYKTTGPGSVRLRWAGGPVPGNTVMGIPYVRKGQ